MSKEHQLPLNGRPVIIFDKTYAGFEDAVDLERDIAEMYEYSPFDIPEDFQGKLRVHVTYYPPPSLRADLIDLVNGAGHLPKEHSDQLLDLIAMLPEYYE